MLAPPQLLEVRLSRGEWARALLWAVGLFAGLGTLTALWDNPWFIRMTPVSPWDYGILGGESVLLGTYLGLRAAPCAIKQASIGGILGFLGFGCALCNKLLMLALGATALMTYFEPVRPVIGGIGLAVLTLALYVKMGRRLDEAAAPKH